jgi:hypothetical protein
MSTEFSIREALDRAAAAATGVDARARKKNFAERLSRELAQLLADALRHRFREITPTADGRQHERRTRSSKGVKKLDVNYSTPDLGLGLGISVKTLNSVDEASGRYTKNFSRIDNELRAEAKDYHERQPFAVMIAIVFLPSASCADGSAATPSSFGGAVQKFRHRANRHHPRDEHELFERVFMACYDEDGDSRGRTWFFDVTTPPPRTGLPVASTRISFSGLLSEITRTYEQRNEPPDVWADASK